MILKKNLMNKYYNLKNNVLVDYDDDCHHKVIEESSSNDTEILRVKNIFKVGTPLPLEPSLYSPIHLLGEKKTN